LSMEQDMAMYAEGSVGVKMEPGYYEIQVRTGLGRSSFSPRKVSASPKA
jgi:hypothetical protein